MRTAFLLVCAFLLVLAPFVELLPWASAAGLPRCTYTIENTYANGRVALAVIYRNGAEVGRIHFNDRSNWYWVECVNGGVDPAETFQRMRDADWATCQRCY